MRPSLILLTVLFTACGADGSGETPPPVEIASPQATAQTQPAAQVEPAELAGITAAHNRARAAVRTNQPLAPLRWSSELAQSAQRVAEVCRFEHSENRGDRGENLAAYAGRDGTPAGVVESWAAEEKDYDLSRNRCRRGKMCGHYTQIVWRNTTEVGCAVNRCRKNSPFRGFREWQLWVCQYAPAGNYVGQRPY